jgi:DNA-binding winged helix-turn-helix (wHTH) protein/tetratricopeptide (TPR) repeat protein/TolB-like protein
LHHATIFWFGPFALDPAQRVLLRGREPLRLTPKEVDVLIALVERHGEIVEKEWLLGRVWQGVCVEECNLSQHIAALRRVLGDDAKHPRFIETVPRRGYRFTAPVAHAETPGTGERVTAPAPAALEEAKPTPAATLPPAPSSLDGVSAPAPTHLPESPSAAGRSLPMRLAAVALSALAALAFAWWMGGSRDRAAGPRARSLVVLPLENLTGDEHHGGLAEALTGSLMGALGELDGVRAEVASPPGGIPHRHRADDVDAIVETGLIQAEGNVRLVAELIDARTGWLVWADVFDMSPVSGGESGRQVARAIGAQLGASLDAVRQWPEHGRLAAARREYALAREYLSHRTPRVVHEALEHFTSAVQLDPGYALPLVGLAEAYFLAATHRLLPPAEALSSAERAARRAVELDQNLAEAHAALGELAAARWDFETAEALYRRALELDPAIGSIHGRYASLLTIRDRHEESIAEARIARDLDPGCPAAGTGLAAAYYHAGRHDPAVQQALAVLRQRPRFPAAYDVLGWAHLAEGRNAEAIAAFAEAVRLSRRSPTYVAGLAHAHARAGAHPEARRLLAELERSARDRAASPLDLAAVLAALGDTDRALEHVERAVAGRTPLLGQFDASLGLAALHDRPRFQALLAKAAAPVPGPPGAGAEKAPDPRSERRVPPASVTAGGGG